jgi:putative transposase
MEKCTKETQFIKEENTWSVLEQVARKGAQKMLQLALENEVEEFIQKHSTLTDENGKKVVTKNGYMPQRDIVTGMGPMPIKQPRIDDRNLKGYSHERFTSNILPRYLRRIPSIDNLIPALYLKGISTNDFPAALSAILGQGAAGLSAANIVRLKESWQKDYQNLKKQGLVS